MAEKLTPQQQQAVSDRGGKLLVSAAAGSGKTKVLVDRLMSYLTDPEKPANLDEFLIITYTKAAAAELRGKIAKKLTEHIAREPENTHLQRQLQYMYLTKISTVHSFCSDILREYAYQLDIPGDFRVADENECRELRDTCMEKLLERSYADASQDPDFCAFVNSQGLGRDDRLVPEILLKVYDSARCHLDPEKWLDKVLADSGAEGAEDASQTLWGRYLMDDLFRFLDLQIGVMEQCAELAAGAEAMEKPAILLRDTVYQLQMLRNSHSWDDVLKYSRVDFGRMTFSKKITDPELAERIKAVRAACKKNLEKKLKAFSDDSAQVLQDLQASSAAVRGIVKLVRDFGKDYSAVKRSRRVMDFGDLEHKMLDLLLGSGRTGSTVAARELGNRFREVMVDEYQDSNEVQDAIFSTLTAGKNNCFMVGDVKQSIYQFRLADPGIFLDKYETYRPVRDAVPGEGRKVLLSHNFRSGGAILSGVNDIFKTVMSVNVGGLDYTAAEALREGVPHDALGEPEVEFYAVDVNNTSYEDEASFVAHRIAELLDGTHNVRQGDQLRPIGPEDIVILLRSPGSVGGYFRAALEKRGIRCASGGGEDLLQTEEIATFRAVLQVISNPRQDIPLLAALASPVFGFTADDLAQLRSVDKKCCIFDCLRKDTSEKSKVFLETLDTLRSFKRMHSLTQLTEQILLLTRLDSVYGAMPDGEVRKKNLQIFYNLVADYESQGRKELDQFLDHLKAMEEKGLLVSADEGTTGAVTVMSIHKSKGLEFPVVFVCGLAREFNRESLRAQVLCDKTLGLGLSAADERNRVRYPTVAKRAIASKMASESLSEEMRVLYVALTRARDRLIMTYTSSNLQKELQEMVLRMDMGHRELLTGDVVCPGEWVLMAALRRTEAGELFAIGGKPEHTAVTEYPWRIAVVQAPEECGSCSEVMERTAPDQRLLERIRKGLAFRYAHPQAVSAPSKQTATQRKGREKDAEAAQFTQKRSQEPTTWRKPSFIDPEQTGTARGNATHIAMQYIRYELCDGVDGVQKEVERLIGAGFLTQEQAELVDCDRIAAFFKTSLGEKLRGGKNLLREFKFSVLDDGSCYHPDLKGEKILLQGVVDCAIIEQDGITVIDFKTDRVSEKTLPATVEKYAPQVRTYAEALSRIYQMPIKCRYLYFFAMDRLAEIE